MIDPLTGEETPKLTLPTTGISAIINGTATPKPPPADDFSTTEGQTAWVQKQLAAGGWPSSETPDYWVKRINDTGGFTGDNLNYWTSNIASGPKGRQPGGAYYDPGAAGVAPAAAAAPAGPNPGQILAALMAMGGQNANQYGPGSSAYNTAGFGGLYNNPILQMLQAGTMPGMPGAQQGYNSYSYPNIFAPANTSAFGGFGMIPSQWGGAVTAATSPGSSTSATSTAGIQPGAPPPFAANLGGANANMAGPQPQLQSGFFGPSASDLQNFAKAMAQWQANGGGGGANVDANTPGIPPDTAGLRQQLSSWLSQAIQQGPQQYGGSFNLPTPAAATQAGNMANLSPALISQLLGPGQGALGNILAGGGTDVSGLLGPLAGLLSNPTPSVNVGGINSWANAIGQQGGGIINSAVPFAQNIAATGGAPTQALLSALSALQTQGNVGITNNLAAIRQQYSNLGLGSGSDVNSALASGAAQGQATLNANQSSLLAQVLQQAAQTQLGGVNALGSLGQGMGSVLSAGGNLAATGQQLGLQAQTTGLNTTLQALIPGLQILNNGTQNQLSAAGILGQYGGVMNNSFGNSMQSLLGLGQLGQQANLYTNQQQYQDFLRQIGLTPQQQAALGLATSYPPLQNQIPSAGATLGAGALSASGSIISAMIAAGLL